VKSEKEQELVVALSRISGVTVRRCDTDLNTVFIDNKVITSIFFRSIRIHYATECSTSCYEPKPLINQCQILFAKGTFGNDSELTHDDRTQC